MKRILGWTGLVLAGALLGIPEVEAKRLGGGRSVGIQRSVATPPPSAPRQALPAQQQPASPVAAPRPAQAQPAAAAQPQAASGWSRWMPVIGGLALGGLLGSFFADSPLLAALASVLLVALVVFAVVALARMLAARRGVGSAPLQYAALGRETVVAPPPSQALDPVVSTPWQARRAPEGFDTAAFLRAAKFNFMRLQAANDARRLEELREFTTPELFESLRDEIEARMGEQTTELASVEAELLEVVTEGDQHWASVRFSGYERERGEPRPFSEVWNLVKPVDGSTGWLLAGIQQTH